MNNNDEVKDIRLVAISGCFMCPYCKATRGKNIFNATHKCIYYEIYYSDKMPVYIPEHIYKSGLFFWDCPLTPMPKAPKDL